MRVLVTGGAGYIGSVVVERLLQAGHEVVVIDNLWRGHAAAIGQGAECVIADLCDGLQLLEIVRTHRPAAVMHFAAATLVPESMRDPALYFRTNVRGSLNLLEACRDVGVSRFVFSSTAAVYGEPPQIPILETAPTQPINVYGQSKLMVEQMLAAFAEAYGLCYAAFRYFNVAGATFEHGEDHDPETHLIPVALQAILGLRDHLSIFGTDYPTPDGTAIRDYVHVIDLADAHIAALGQLERPLGPINLGTRTGFSVREVVDAVQRVTGRTLPIELKPRRPGDPPALVADSSRAADILDWRPAHSTLDDMIGSAWTWLQRHPNGYRSR